MTLRSPGSHDSFAFHLSTKDPIAPDVEKTAFGKLARTVLKRPVKSVIHKWSITQSMTFTEQLHAGIRYFDLRLGSKVKETGSKTVLSEDDHVKGLHFVHGLYGVDLKRALIEVHEFLHVRDREVVILHFQHFYNFDKHKHKCCLNVISKTFAGKLCHAYGDFRHVTLSSLWDNRHQVLVIYNHEVPEDLKPFIWPVNRIDSQWPNVTSPESLIAYLQRGYERRRNEKNLFVSQAILTPDTGLIVKHVGSSLKEKCGKKAAKPISKWLLSKTPGDHCLNICIVDFVEMENFVANVIRLNV